MVTRTDPHAFGRGAAPEIPPDEPALVRGGEDGATVGRQRETGSPPELGSIGAGIALRLDRRADRRQGDRVADADRIGNALAGRDNESRSVSAEDQPRDEAVHECLRELLIRARVQQADEAVTADRKRISARAVREALDVAGHR